MIRKKNEHNNFVIRIYEYKPGKQKKKKRIVTYSVEYLISFIFSLLLQLFFFCFPQLYWRGRFESALKKKNKRDLNDNNTVFFCCYCSKTSGMLSNSYFCHS